MTNDLKRRLTEHYESRGKQDHFASKYFCYRLLYFEKYDTPQEAIYREKEIKDFSRERKMQLIRTTNQE